MKSLTTLTVCALVGIKEAQLEGSSVTGRWEDFEKLRLFCGPRGRLLVEDFVNWSDAPPEILRFTRVYGPVTDAFREDELGEGRGGEFSFEVEDWRFVQTTFQRIWNRIASPNFASEPGREQVHFSGVLPNDSFWVYGNRFEYRAGTLEGFMRLELLRAPIDRLRKCLRPGCETPYFIARHLRQSYCSPTCAQWAQRKWKKQWWQKEGPHWLSRRRGGKRKSMERRQRRAKPRSGAGAFADGRPSGKRARRKER